MVKPRQWLARRQSRSRVGPGFEHLLVYLACPPSPVTRPPPCYVKSFCSADSHSFKAALNQNSGEEQSLLGTKCRDKRDLQNKASALARSVGKGLTWEERQLKTLSSRKLHTVSPLSQHLHCSLFHPSSHRGEGGGASLAGGRFAFAPHCVTWGWYTPLWTSLSHWKCN